MKTRPLGRTGWPVSELGFGAWGIGANWWGPTDDAESLQALTSAWDAGVTFFDTAYVYGDGHSERLVGQALAGKPARIATKIPPKNNAWPPKTDADIDAAFPGEWIRSCTERSLKNLGRETVDLQQFHVWTNAWLKRDEWKETVSRLKQEGKIRAFGVSINDHDPDSALELVASGLVDTVQVIFNIFDQSPVERLFPLCLRHNVGVIVRVPLDEGGLTGALNRETQFPKGDFRGQYFRGDNLAQTVERVERLTTLLGPEAKSMPELALRFILSHDAVSTVIAGMRRHRHVSANAAVSDGRRLSPTLTNDLRGHAWKRNFYGWWD